MKMFFSQKRETGSMPEEDLSPVALQDSIEKTRQALDDAYAGFDNALDVDLIDSYIYEVNAIQMRYKFLLCRLKSYETAEPLYESKG